MKKHRIRRQTWAVLTSSEEVAFRLRQYLHEHGQEILLPALEKVFDEAVPDNIVVHIPRIELKVKTDSEGKLTQYLPGIILKQLSEQMQSVMNRHKKSMHEDPISRSLLCRETPEQADRFEILLNYLHTGLLPWYGDSVTGESEGRTEALLREICHEEWRQLMEYLLTIQESEAVYFRLLQLMPDEELKSLITGISDAHSRQLGGDLMQCMDLLFNSENIIPNRYLRLRTSAMLFSESLKWKGNGPVPDLFKMAIDYLPEESGIILRQAWDDNQGVMVSLSNHDMQSGAFSGEPLMTPLTQSEMKIPLNPPFSKGETLSPPLEKGGQGGFENLFPLKVQYAGLTLLHPFITRFFETTGIIEKENDQLPPFALPRAAALLHFLATGAVEIFEYELGIIKILLGLHPETPLPVSEGLINTGDMEEAEAMLKAVIGHWSILKNTSINGLRSSFLQRSALVSEEETGWLLQIEQKPYDILFEQLPWSISIIKLLWMKKPIYTEW